MQDELQPRVEARRHSARSRRPPQTAARITIPRHDGKVACAGGLDADGAPEVFVAR